MAVTRRDSEISVTIPRTKTQRRRRETSAADAARQALSKLDAAHKRGEIKKISLFDLRDFANSVGAPVDAESQDEDKLRAMINRAFENIELTRKRMANDQIEIVRLRSETRAAIAQLLA